METFFAPAERTNPDLLKKQVTSIQSEATLIETLNFVPEMIMVLNQERQLVYGNKSLLDFVKENNLEEIISKRPGEILDCIHSKLLEGGCGTSEFCRTCGAANAIINSQTGIPDVQECRITQNTTGFALDLRIWSSQLTIKDDVFTLAILADIGNEKRRKALERIFYHDILNTAGGIKGVSDLLLQADSEIIDELKEMISQLSGQLIDEIKSQQLLQSAEENDLLVDYRVISVYSLIKEVISSYRKHTLGQDREIETSLLGEELYIKSDSTILKRVIGNMVKNALEASDEGAVVKVNCRAIDSIVRISVNNNIYMPRDIQLQIFRRSFSTKGMGRGLGTYSIKLLTERYLKGTVGFVSTIEGGTEFYIELPLIKELLS